MGLPRLAASLFAAIPFSIASGTLLGAPVSKGTKSGAAIMIFIASLLISVDICSRAGKDYKYFIPMTILMFLGIYVPWVLTIDKKPDDKTRTMALPLSGLFASLIVLGVAAAAGGGALTKSESLQGAVITLMYMFVSTSLGYQAVRAKKEPGAKAQSIYMAGLLVLLLMFDILGGVNAPANAANQAERAAHAGLVAERLARGEGVNGLGEAGAQPPTAQEAVPA